MFFLEKVLTIVLIFFSNRNLNAARVTAERVSCNCFSDPQPLNKLKHWSTTTHEELRYPRNREAG